jgi:hypothetical protein
MKSPIRRSGRWQVPRRFTCVVYKGAGLIDLREAELTAAVTTIRAVAYKSRTEVVLPAGVRLELGGTGVSAAEAGGPDVRVPDDAPVVRIWGLAYRGTIEAITRS